MNKLTHTHCLVFAAAKALTGSTVAVRQIDVWEASIEAGTVADVEVNKKRFERIDHYLSRFVVTGI
jgi:hypothetical protein